MAVIETPKGNPDRYDYDEIGAVRRPTGVMPGRHALPYGLGPIRSILGQDDWLVELGFPDRLFQSDISRPYA
jgi:hypothetical protein